MKDLRRYSEVLQTLPLGSKTRYPPFRNITLMAVSFGMTSQPHGGAHLAETILVRKQYWCGNNTGVEIHGHILLQ